MKRYANLEYERVKFRCDLTAITRNTLKMFLKFGIMTGREIARKAGINQPTVSNFLMGKDIRLETAIKMWKVLGLELVGPNGIGMEPYPYPPRGEEVAGPPEKLGNRIRRLCGPETQK